MTLVELNARWQRSAHRRRPASHRLHDIPGPPLPEREPPHSEDDDRLIEVAPGTFMLASDVADLDARCNRPQSASDFVIGNETLTTRDTRSLALQTGRTINDRDGLRRWEEDSHLRCMEKGDGQHRRRRELEEWHKSGKNREERGPLPNTQHWKTE